MGKTTRFLAQGEDFSFPSDFGFSGSTSVSPRNHPTMNQNEFGDDAKLAAGAETPTYAKGGKAKGAPPAAAGGSGIPPAGQAVMKALQLGKAIGQVQGRMSAAGVQPPAPGAPPAGGGALSALGGGGLPRPGAGVMPGAPPPGAGPAMKKGGKFIQKAIKKPGELHRDLGVPQGEKIPAEKLEAAASRPGKVGQRARFAETLKGMNHSKKGK